MIFLIKASQLLLSLSILVVLHELGHFLPAKYFKTKVEKFYLFFDPWFSVFKKKDGINAIQCIKKLISIQIKMIENPLYSGPPIEHAKATT